MKTILLFCLALFFVGLGVSAADSYTVNTRSMLNMRSGPAASYDVVTQLAPGSSVTMIEDNGKQWVQIEQNGKRGYVMKKYLDYDGVGSTAVTTSNTVDTKKKSSSSSRNEWLLWTVVALFIVFLSFNFIDIDNWFLTIAIYILLPSSVILYCAITPNAMWFCDPDEVGWVLTIINFFLVMMALAFLWGVFKTLVSEVFSDFSFLELIICLLFGAALVYFVITAIKELLIMAVIMIIGAAGGGQKVGTFVANDGTSYDVFRR